MQNSDHFFPALEMHKYLIDNAFMGTIVNRVLPSLHGGSLEITLTVS